MKLLWIPCALMLVAAVWGIPAPVSADELDKLEGRYSIVGWEPGSDPDGPHDYTGRAILVRWGQTLRYHAVIDDMTYAGAAIYDDRDNSMCLSFTNGDGSERGVSHLIISGNVLKGYWVLDNGGKGDLGYEIWNRY